nr:CsgG/HfaB family protein [uncultured Rhodopila sp.]
MSRSRLHTRGISRIVATVLLLAGCVQDPLPSPTPQVMDEDEIPLPPKPKHSLTVGVYNCIDTTGQKRPTGTYQELSSAVPLDCTPYLIEAVRALTPGYIFLVERQHVDELLRERQLATLALNSAAEAQTTDPAHPAAHRRLATLRVAELLLIGQVVAYDRETRQITGGLAIGGSNGTGSVITDVFTFSLRAVAVQTGEVLGQTTVTKSVTSVKIGGQTTQILPVTVLNIEAGIGGNEAVGLALRVAVRSALGRLINQGVQDGWWS